MKSGVGVIILDDTGRVLLERRRVRTASLLYYGFFAAFMPVIAFRFLAQDRLVAFASGPWTLVYSVPVAVLLGFWFHCARSLCARITR